MPLASTARSIDANGNWTYSLNNSSQVVQDLKPGQVVKETFEVVSADGSAKQTITIDGGHQRRAGGR